MEVCVGGEREWEEREWQNLLSTKFSNLVRMTGKGVEDGAEGETRSDGKEVDAKDDIIGPIGMIWWPEEVIQWQTDKDDESKTMSPDIPCLSVETKYRLETGLETRNLWSVTVQKVVVVLHPFWEWFERTHAPVCRLGLIS